ncbi:MAG: MarR family transcriptional regulator, partial [Ktedonobacteraceae bacterium]
MPVRYDDNLGYWLFYSQRIVAHAFTGALRMCCEEQNKPYVVTPPQWGLLALLSESDSLTIGSISLKRGLDPPTVTGIVNRLENNGLVERRHDKEDRRVVKVYLTDEGRDIIR